MVSVVLCEDSVSEIESSSMISSIVIVILDLSEGEYFVESGIFFLLEKLLIDNLVKEM